MNSTHDPRGSGPGSAQNLRSPEGNDNPDPPPGPPGEGGGKSRTKNRLEHSQVMRCRGRKRRFQMKTDASRSRDLFWGPLTHNFPICIGCLLWFESCPGSLWEAPEGRGRPTEDLPGDLPGEPREAPEAPEGRGRPQRAAGGPRRALGDLPRASGAPGAREKGPAKNGRHWPSCAWGQNKN